MNFGKPRLTKSLPLSRTSLRELPPATITTSRSYNPQCRTLLSSYTSFLCNNIPPPPSLYPPLLTSINSSSQLGPILHGHIVVTGYTTDPYISSSLLSMYSKTGNLDSARMVFNAMPVRTVVPWSAMIGAYSQTGNVADAFSFFRAMLREGTEPNSVTMLGLLAGVFELKDRDSLHGWVVRSGFSVDVVISNKMLDVYSRSGCLDSARKLFDAMRCFDIITWNTMISGYSKVRNPTECVWLFNRMRIYGIVPDHQTYVSLLSSTTASGNNEGGFIKLGKQVHAKIVTSGFEMDSHITTTLVATYLKFKNSGCASILFQMTQHKDVVSWTAMMSGLVQNDKADEALMFFQRMLTEGCVPSSTTVSTALAACAHLGSLRHGASIHGYVIRARLAVDRAAENSLLSMYSKCGYLRQSQAIFDSMQDKDVVSWNALLAAYAQNGYLKDTFFVSNQMRLSKTQPDSITITTLLQACSLLGSLHHGRCVHSFVVRHRITGSSISIVTSLVDMYAKSGDLRSAQACFDAVEERDIFLWTAIITAYGSNGMADAAMRLYTEFCQTGQKPNHVMILAVLTACSHAGLVLLGLEIYRSMQRDFKIQPGIEHTACVIDLLGRARMIEEALKIVKEMPHKPNPEILGILLDACRTNRRCSGLAEEIAAEISALKPTTAGSYVQLAHTYASVSRWNDVEDSWRKMRSLGLRKAPAWSFIEVNGVISTFFADHDSHPRYEEIIWLLKVLDGKMRKYMLRSSYVMRNEVIRTST